MNANKTLLQIVRQQSPQNFVKKKKNVYLKILCRDTYVHTKQTLLNHKPKICGTDTIKFSTLKVTFQTLLSLTVSLLTTIKL